MAPHRSENPVVLSRIYTRTGDDGTTALGDGSRTAKTDPRLAAYADVDEANTAIASIRPISSGWRPRATRTTRTCRRCAASCCRAAAGDRRCCTWRGR
jgi:cob(I)alamin adenosyltransferase